MAATAKTTTTKKVTTKETTPVVKTESFSLKVYALDGKADGTLALPKNIFDVKVSPTMIAQAIRVYLANFRYGNAATQTRGSVRGGGRKPFKQKGTGRARQGSSRSPINVGGGTTFGPRPHAFDLKLPSKMRLSALAMALSQKNKDGKVIAVSGLETLPAKTKAIATALKVLPDHKKYLILVDKKHEKFELGARNIPNIEVQKSANLNAYHITNGSVLVLTAESLKALEERWTKVK